MNKVLEGQEDHLAAYIDDVVIFSNSWEEHLGPYQGSVRGIETERVEHNTRGKGASIGELYEAENQEGSSGFSGYYRVLQTFYRGLCDPLVSLYISTKKSAPTVVEWTDDMCCEFSYLCNAYV